MRMRLSAAPRSASLLAQRLDAFGAARPPRAMAMASASVACASERQRFGEVVLLGVDEGLGVDPRQMCEESFAAADLVGEVLAAARLAGLALQAFDLRAELAHDVGEAGEVGFGALQAQLGLVAAAVQARRRRRRPPARGGAARAWR